MVPREALEICLKEKFLLAKRAPLPDAILIKFKFIVYKGSIRAVEFIKALQFGLPTFYIVIIDPKVWFFFPLHLNNCKGFASSEFVITGIFCLWYG